MRYRWFFNVALLALCLFVPPRLFGQSTVTCSSDDEGRHSCAADTRGGVQLQSQQSGSPCTEGYSWGHNDQGVWVDHGCRATFAVGGRPGYQNRDNQDGENQNGRGGQTQIVTCNSDDEGRHSCAADTRGGVQLQSQQSSSPCTEGYSWGYNNQGVWVDHGCRANFAVGGYSRNRDYGNDGYGNGGNGQTQTVTCNSDDEKKHYCTADTRGGVQLQSQQSDSPCTEGYSWGYNDRGVWVDHGCRAAFTVGGGGRSRTRQRRP
jgi:hypothetical protein